MKLETINELLNYLNPNKKDVKKCSEGMKSLQVDGLRLKEYLFWDDEQYTRNLISKTESFELFACCWEPGQSSVMHDLNGQDGWIKVLSGQLDFEVVPFVNSMSTPSTELRKEINHLKKGDLYEQHSNTQMYQIINRSDKRAVSLHLNSLPISYYNVMSGMGTDVDLINIEFYSINGNII